MKTILTSLFFLGLTSLGYSQSSSSEIKEVKLDKILLSPNKNVSYLNKVDDKSISKTEQNLEKDAANYDITKTEVFNNNFDTYEVMFKGTAGSIVATYDNKGKLINAFEKFENSSLPDVVRNTIHKEFPDWTIHKTVYRVNYYNNDNNPVRKIYQIQIMKGNDKKNLKIDSDGNNLSKKLDS